MAGMTITRNRKRTESNLRVQRRACETRAAVLAGKKPLNHRWRWYHEESRHLIICDRAIRLIAIHFYDVWGKGANVTADQGWLPTIVGSILCWMATISTKLQDRLFYFSQRLLGDSYICMITNPMKNTYMLVSENYHTEILRSSHTPIVDRSKIKSH